MTSAAEQFASNINLASFAKGRRAEEAPSVHPWRAYCLSPRHVYSHPWHQSRKPMLQQFQQQQGGLLGTLNIFRWRRRRTDGDFCPQHHAIYLGVDHHDPDDRRDPISRSDQERG